MTPTILIVDDEPDMLILLERILTVRGGYRVVTTNNPLEVASLLDEHDIRVVITDYSMPGMTGLDVLRLVNERGGGERVILITAFGDHSTSSEASRLGVCAYIHKPFRKEQILEALADAVAS